MHAGSIAEVGIGVRGRLRLRAKVRVREVRVMCARGQHRSGARGPTLGRACDPTRLSLQPSAPARACNPSAPTRCAPTRCAPTCNPTCGRLQPYVSEVGEVEQPKLQLDEAHYDRFRCWECATLLEA